MKGSEDELDWDSTTNIAGYAGVVHDLVNVVCCDTGFAGAGGFVEDFSGQTANLAHGCYAFFIEDVDFVSSYIRVVGYARL